ncbi:MAG: MopE-related protein [Myxococcota bacterium]
MSRALPFAVLFALACNGSTKQDALVDLDGDGFDQGEDCNDDDPEVHPGAAERCNGLDDDCDDAIDEFLPTIPSYADGDGDGWGREGARIDACAVPDGFAEQAGDCDDTDPAFHPFAPEPCTEAVDYNCDGSIGYADADADGTPACRDCDDLDSDVHPGAVEWCNHVDDDCNGVPDDDAVDPREWFVDLDHDGYGDADEPTVMACDRPVDHAAVAGDCDDSDSAFHPGAPEDCADPNDYNCDGSTQFDDADLDLSPACLDCNDADAAIHPGAPETCDGVDEDCDSLVDNDPIDPTAYFLDADGDGFGDLAMEVDACEPPPDYVTEPTDCNDDDPAISPAATEICDPDLVDEDCDTLADDADPSADPETMSPWYVDADLDGYGVDGPLNRTACHAPPGYATTADDCDDAASGVNPGALEVCDGLVDEDCDGLVDDDDTPSDPSTWHADADGDGFGNAAVSLAACAAPAGYVADDTDCNDGDGTAFPGADETCDGVDDDCDTVVDNDPIDPATFYRDLDGDGYGTPVATVVGCVAPAGYAPTDDDCDDTRADVSPGAAEVCDAAQTDEDCDTLADDLDPDVTGTSTFFADADNDGYGDPAAPRDACLLPPGHVVNPADCDDADPAQHPGAFEIVGNGQDDDCNGSEICYEDADGDGYVTDSPGTIVSADGDCADAFEALATAPAGDCDDTEATAHPGAAEICADGIDNNCVPDTDCVFDGPVAAANASVRIAGENQSDWLGRSLVVADFDGDGHDDLLAGASGYDLPTGSSSAGVAVLFYGPVTAWDVASSADVFITGDVASQYTGYDVAAGDVDGDGIQDAIIGAYGDVTSRGAVYLIYGGFTTTGTTTTGTLAATDGVAFNGETSYDDLGYSVASGGDLDGDGRDELVLGAYGQDGAASSAGAVYLFYGTATPMTGTRTASSADAVLQGTNASDYLGYAVTMVDDVDGDGLDEMLLGAYGNDLAANSAGAAFLVLGSTTRPTGTLTAEYHRRRGRRRHHHLRLHRACGGGPRRPRRRRLRRLWCRRRRLRRRRRHLLGRALRDGRRRRAECGARRHRLRRQHLRVPGRGAGHAGRPRRRRQRRAHGRRLRRRRRADQRGRPVPVQRPRHAASPPPTPTLPCSGPSSRRRLPRPPRRSRPGRPRRRRRFIGRRLLRRRRPDDVLRRRRHLRVVGGRPVAAATATPSPRPRWRRRRCPRGSAPRPARR